VAYGAADDAGTQMARRVGVILDPEGKVLRWWPKVSARDFPAEALAAIPT
jgi:thioredoxin-dependent peroxiredoxin